MAIDELENNFNKALLAGYIRGSEHRQRSYKHYRQALFYAALGSFVAGLVALAFDFIIIAVTLLGLAAWFQRGSSHYELLEHVAIENHYLARLITRQQYDPPTG